MLEFFAIAILVMAFAQTAPIELAFLLAGDTLMYLEFVVMLRLMAGREHLQAMLRLAARFARVTVQISRVASRYLVSRVGRMRERRNPARAAKPRRISDNSDDGRGFGVAWAGMATA